jgi:PKD repeat protein
MKKLFWIGMLLISSIPSLLAQTQVQFRNENKVFSENIAQILAKRQLAGTQTVEGRAYRWVQFHALPDEATRFRLQKRDIRLHRYLNNRTYLASFPAAMDTENLRQLGIRSIHAIQATEKLDPYLFQSRFPPHAVKGDKLAITLQFLPEINGQLLYQKLEAAGAQINLYAPDYQLLECEVPIDQVYALAQWPELLYLEVMPEPGQPEGFRAVSLLRSNQINGHHIGSPGYDGNGVRLQIRDDGGIGPHVDFQGRLNQRFLNSFSNTTGGIQHADMVGGSAASANNIDPTIQGNATGAQVYVTNYAGNFLDVTLTLHQEAEVMVTNTSYSDGCNAGYTTRSRTVDIQAHENPHLLHIFSSGNDGDQSCGYTSASGWGTITGGHKASKNSIAVGSLNFAGSLSGFSSRGPTADGRIKPELVAMGQGIWTTNPINGYTNTQGTSFSAPSIAGLATQLYHAYRELNQGENPEAALIKAVMMNAAQDIGNAGPDYRHGFGIPHAARSVAILEDKTYWPGSVNTGETDDYSIAIPANVKEARVMLYWADPPAMPANATPLINDLNLSLLNLQGDTILPLRLNPTPNVVTLNQPAVPGVDSLNNVEQVVLYDPAAGNYTVRVNGFSVPEGPQKFYVLYTFLYDSLEVTYPQGGESLAATESEVIRWDAYGTATPLGTFTLEYTLNNGLSWLPIVSGLGPETRSYNWTVPPASTGRARVRISRGTQNAQSQGNFTIMRVPNNLAVTQVCPDYTSIDWDQVPGAIGYDIFVLGEKYMDSVGSTPATQTSYQIPNLDPDLDTWISVRAISADSTPGRRTFAVNRPPGLQNCPIALDVALKSVTRPIGNDFPDCIAYELQAGVFFENKGLINLTNIPVFYQLSGDTTIYADTIKGIFPPGTSQVFIFNQKFPRPDVGTYELKFWTGQSGDQVASNDTVVHALRVFPSTSFGLPYQEDFESMNLCSTASGCESDECVLGEGWFNLPNQSSDDIDWRVNRGITPTPLTGPDVDQKPGTVSGQYLYLEASGDCMQKEAWAWTPCIDLQGSTDPELSFWYHRLGDDLGPLSVDILWNGFWFQDFAFVSFGSSPLWQQRNVNLKQFSGQTILIRFRGNTGDGFQSDLAIDNLAIYDRAQAPISDFVADRLTACVGSAVGFTDQSQNAPTAWQWSFEPNTVNFLNGTNAQSQNPVVAFEGVATYTVRLLSQNANGSDTLERLAYVKALEGVLPGWTEDFEANAFPPQDWDLYNPDASFAWAVSDATGSDGTNTRAAWLDNRSYNNPGTPDGLLTLITDLSTADQPRLAFDLAYVGRGPSRKEDLWIEISTDCGTSFTQSILQANGATIATAPDEADPWFPFLAEQWQRDTLDLSAYKGQQIQLRFVNINAHGNGMFLDNIQLFEAGQAGPNASMSISNAFDCEDQAVVFEDASAGGPILSHTWDFGTGANPATATGPGPHNVVFSDPGGQLVSLTVTGNSGSHSSTHALSIQPKPGADFTVKVSGGLVAFDNLTTNGNSYVWDFGDGSPVSTKTNPAHNYLANDNYTVSLIATNDCGQDTFTYALAMNTVDIEAELPGLSMQVYPNPNPGQFELWVAGSQNRDFQLTVMDLSGKVLLEQTVLQSGTEFSRRFDLREHPAGLYLLRIQSGSEARIIKVLKE